MAKVSSVPQLAALTKNTCFWNFTDGLLHIEPSFKTAFTSAQKASVENVEVWYVERDAKGTTLYKAKSEFDFLLDSTNKKISTLITLSKQSEYAVDWRISIKITPDTDKGSWTGNTVAYPSSGYAQFSSTGTPGVPSVPELEWNSDTNKLVVRSTASDSITKWINFKVYSFDEESSSAGSELADSDWIAVGADEIAAYTVSKLSGGQKYKAKARAANEKKTKCSVWSEFTGTAVQSEPLGKVGLLGITTISKCSTVDNAVRVYFADDPSVSGAESYIIEYCPHTKDYFVSDPDMVQTVTATMSEAQKKYDQPKGSRVITGLTSGEKYYFKICAVNEAGQSGWYGVYGDADNNSYEFILGEKPAAPTTWSLQSEITNNESMNLYWVHNSKDGSIEKMARLLMTVNGVALAEKLIEHNQHTETAEEDDTDAVEDEEDTTTEYYTLPTSSYTDDTVIKWKVRTRGIYGNFADVKNPTAEEIKDAYSPYSTERTIYIYHAPTLNVVIVDDIDYDWDKAKLTDSSVLLETGIIHTTVNETDISTDADAGVSITVADVKTFPFYFKMEMSTTTQTPITYSISLVYSKDERFANDEYTYFDAYGEQATVKPGDTVYTRNVDTNSTPIYVTVGAGEANLVNGGVYEWTCSVTTNVGLTATKTGYVQANIPTASYSPSLEYTVNHEDLTVSLCPAVLDDSGNRVSYVSLFIYRVDPDGEYTQIGTSVINADASWVTDTYPSLGEVLRYRIVARDNTKGTYSYSDFVFDDTFTKLERCIAIQFDSPWTEFLDIGTASTAEVKKTTCIKLPYNVDISESNELDAVAVEYIGRKHPVAYYGTQVGQKRSLKCEIPKTDTENLYKLRKLANYMGNAYVRDPAGNGYWSNVNVSFDINHKELTVPVTIDVTRVEE